MHAYVCIFNNCNQQAAFVDYYCITVRVRARLGLGYVYCITGVELRYLFYWTAGLEKSKVY